MNKKQDQKRQHKKELDRYGQCGHFHDKGVFWPTVKITFDCVGWKKIMEDLKTKECSLDLVW